MELTKIEPTRQKRNSPKSSQQDRNGTHRNRACTTKTEFTNIEPTRQIWNSPRSSLQDRRNKLNSPRPQRIETRDGYAKKIGLSFDVHLDVHIAQFAAHASLNGDVYWTRHRHWHGSDVKSVYGYTGIRTCSIPA